MWHYLWTLFRLKSSVASVIESFETFTYASALSDCTLLNVFTLAGGCMFMHNSTKCFWPMPFSNFVWWRAIIVLMFISKKFWPGVSFFSISFLEDNDNDQLYTISTRQYSRLQSSPNFSSKLFCIEFSSFFYKYYYTTTSKLKITITRHQNILAGPGNNKKCKSN